MNPDVIPAPGPHRLPGDLIHAVVPFLILGTAGFWLHSHWDLIPERFPVHWNLAGNPDRWSTRTVGGVYLPLTFSISAILTVVVSTSGVIRSSGQPQVRAATARLLRVLGYLMSFLFSAIALLPLYPGKVPIVWIVVLLVAATIALSIPIFRARGDSDKRKAPGLWRFGIFYYNPYDSSVMVPKRIGIGYTVNFASPWAWLLLGVGLALPTVTLLRNR